MFYKMTKNIKFIARDPYGWEVYPKPYPAATAVPSWWKDSTPYKITDNNPDGKKFFVENLGANTTFKKCTPMLDALTAGYIVPLYTDVQMRWTPNGPLVTWRVKGSDVFSPHGPEGKVPGLEIPTGYSDYIFKYNNTWIPKTPPGYSVLITSPFGYRNLPFYAIPAIVDSDKSSLEIVPPMWIKQNFEGIIEKGTPMFQVIPFKRESWKTEFDFYPENEYQKITDKTFNSTLVNHYIKNVWSRKTFK